MKKLLIVGLASALLSCEVNTQTQNVVEEKQPEPTGVSEPTQSKADLASVLMDKNEGCLTGPVEQFGRYIGDWNIQDWSFSPEGKWVEQQGARWNFTCVGNGVAVQDFWMPNTGGFGTNLRIYDPKTEQWEIAWSATGAPGFSHIRAREDENGNVVMHYVSPPQTPPRRITFYQPTAQGWDWLLEMDLPVTGAEDGATQWRGVYKIKATKR